ncbi:MAG: DUF6268 family outer membrane beta-barrel protein [Chitinophagales bacterium]|nr:DUF6268 family outer membrane beta-barrel protein [Chitinophagales bacterium]
MPPSCLLKSFFVLLSTCLCTLTAHTQALVIPVNNQFDMDNDRPIFCRPGVTNKSPGKGVFIQYSGVGGYDITPKSATSKANSSDSEVDYVEKWLAKIKIPLVNSPSLKMMLGYEYRSETFHFDHIGGQYSDLLQAINNKPLRNTKLSYYVTKSFNNKYYAGVRLRVSSRGDYDNWLDLSQRYTTLSGTAAFGVKPHKDLEWGIGLTYNDNFARKRVWPFIVYNQTFNERWGIETLLPAKVMMRYNFKPQSMLLFGAELENGSYAIDVLKEGSENPLPYYYRHTEIGIKASYNQHIFSWIWLNAEAGALVPIRNRFEDAADPLELRYDNSTSMAPFFKIGIFASPPKCLVK